MSADIHIIPAQISKLPRAMYGCAGASCAEEVSYPADLLAYYDGRPILLPDIEEGEDDAYVPDDQLPNPGWYCTEGCWTSDLALYRLVPSEMGPTLELEIERRSKLGLT